MKYHVLPLSIFLTWLVPVHASAQEGDAAAGEVVFKKCAICHNVDSDKNKVGPPLSQLFGRTAGARPGFAYSPAMKKAGEAGLVWSEAELRDYLHNPRTKIKGTKMVFPGLKNDEDITNLIAYLKQYSK